MDTGRSDGSQSSVSILTPGEISSLRTHPDAELFPPMAGPEFEALKKDIEVHGLRDAISLHRGLVLDGVNRLRACRELGITPRFEVWEGEGSTLDFVLAKNARRRHLSTSRRAVVAARLEARLQDGGKNATGEPGPAPGSVRSKQGKARDRAAAALNVSSGLVAAARKVLRQGVDELISSVERNAVTVSAAALIAGLSRDRQAAIVARGLEAIRQEAHRLAAEARDRSRAQESPSQERITERPQSPGLPSEVVGAPPAPNLPSATRDQAESVPPGRAATPPEPEPPPGQNAVEAGGRAGPAREGGEAEGRSGQVVAPAQEKRRGQSPPAERAKEAKTTNRTQHEAARVCDPLTELAEACCCDTSDLVDYGESLVVERMAPVIAEFEEVLREGPELPDDWRPSHPHYLEFRAWLAEREGQTSRPARGSPNARTFHLKGN
jgi:hypothetical protein